ncbi:MAG: SlyX family protein [Treponemataceae bacterium]
MSEKEDESLIRIEKKLAYIEDFLNQLHEVTLEHEKQIQRIDEQSKFFLSKLKDIYENPEGDIPNRKPPHY